MLPLSQRCLRTMLNGVSIFRLEYYFVTSLTKMDEQWNPLLGIFKYFPNIKK